MIKNINSNAISHVLSIIKNPRLIVPHLIVKDIRELNYEKLKKSGINKLIFDKDNTLTIPYENLLYPPFKKSWDECKNTFGVENILIISNSAGTLSKDPNFDQAKEVEKNFAC
nr:14594_t:CDS:2 [Entrophospora candida]